MCFTVIDMQIYQFLNFFYKTKSVKQKKKTTKKHSVW